MTRVLIVDDDALVRAGLTMILGSADDLEVVGEAADGDEAVRRHRPDVVLMDIRMPRMDGLAATQAVTALSPAPRVIVLTTFDLDDFVFRALQAGAGGFPPKATPPPRRPRPAGGAHRAGARGAPRGHPRPEQRRDRTRAVPERGHRRGPRVPAAARVLGAPFTGSR